MKQTMVVLIISPIDGTVLSQNTKARNTPNEGMPMIRACFSFNLINFNFICPALKLKGKIFDWAECEDKNEGVK